MKYHQGAAQSYDDVSPRRFGRWSNVSRHRGTGPPHPAAPRRLLSAWPWRQSALLAPAVLFLLVFFAYPVLKLLELSFSDSALGTFSFGSVSFANFSWFFGTAVNLTVLARTFMTAALVTVLCLLVGYPYAYLMTVVDRRWRSVLMIAVLVPFATSLMARNFAWLVLLQANGPVEHLTQSLGLGSLQLTGTFIGVVIVMAQIMTPFMVLPLYATLRHLDQSLLRAAESLGARPSVAFARIFLPLSLPGVMAGSLLTFVLSLGFYLTPAIIGSPQNGLLSQLIVVQVQNLLDWGHAGAMAIVLLALTALLIWVGSWLATRTSAHASAHDDS